MNFTGLLAAALATGALTVVASHKPTPPPAPYGALPTARQLKWHEMETYAFLHFTVNTFTNKEWGYGDEDPNVFNPTQFNADSIVLALKAAGLKGAILTCKHHDGFCLWPTATTDHNISHSSWMNGHGNVVRAISDACRRHGLKFGVYVSPWDRNNPHYGTPEYVKIYQAQVHELLTKYGPLFEIWHDGANGGDGYYGGARETRSIDRSSYYQWHATWSMEHTLQPDAVVFSDVGPDIRWVGNESGYADSTCWATYDPIGIDGAAPAPGLVRSELGTTGTRNGKQWLPAECDVSIRPGWFWHKAEDSHVKSPAELLNLYYRSVGHGVSFLLNVPPDQRGQLAAEDVKSLNEYGAILRATFKTNLAAAARFTASNIRGNDNRYGPQNLVDNNRTTYWATDHSVTTPELTLDFGKPVEFNVIRLRENIELGQRIEGVAIDSWDGSHWTDVAGATSIGACRLIRLKQSVTTSRVRLRITRSPVCIALSDFGLYREPRGAAK